MGKTHKIERARALHGAQGRQHKEVDLIPTGMPEGLIDTRTGIAHERHVNNGGQRYGNQRKMRAKLKVDERKRERKIRNRAPLDDSE